MLFNSWEFPIFLLVVFTLYWSLFRKNLLAQNLFLVAVGYTFYGWWDVRFLGLLILSSFTDFYMGRLLHKTQAPNRRKLLLAVSLTFNLGLLFFFKYYNWFADSLVYAFSTIDVHLHPRTINVILPVGISFYTFQTLSYTIDIYKKKFDPPNNLPAFLAFVSFFPQLVAGPIERAAHLLPQFLRPRKFSYDYAIDGVRQMLWGFFKKVVIADNCAVFVDQIFTNYGEMPASTLVVGAILFAFQIYCDFSGYSDIALGTAKLLGFELMRNFAYPYFSRDIAEFWRRWHISLTTWFRDYVYFPLGGSRGTKWQSVINTFIVFIVSGLWHGANWTFVMWGALNAAFFIPLLLLGKNRDNLGNVAENRWLPTLSDGLRMLLTFIMITFTWIFFRSASVGDAFAYIGRLFDPSILTFPAGSGYQIFPMIFLMLGIEWIQRDKQHALQIENIRFPAIRWAICYAIFLVIVNFGARQQTFIYFQF